MAQFKVLRNVLMTLLVFVSMFVAVDMDGLSMVLTDVELADVPLNVKLEAAVDDDVVELKKQERFKTSFMGCVVFERLFLGFTFVCQILIC